MEKLTDGFGPKTAIFQLFFQAIQVRKISFTIFQREKTPFQAIKSRSLNCRKIDIFSKGVKPWFWFKKGLFFQRFFFRQYMPVKYLLRYSSMKKRLSRLQKQQVQKLEKLTFFHRCWPMVLVQKWSIFQLFVLGNRGRENILYDSIGRKNAFLGYN